MSWKFAAPRSGNTYAGLGILKNVPDKFELSTGTPRAAGFPDNAKLEMNPRYPKQIALADSYSCGDRLWIASARLGELVAQHTPRDLELLPVTIFDHKGRAVEAKHVLINPTLNVDAIDRAKSVIEWNDIDPDDILTAKPLVVDESKLPTDLGVVRLKGLSGFILVSQPLQDAITAAGMTGILWMPIESWSR